MEEQKEERKKEGESWGKRWKDGGRMVSGASVINRGDCCCHPKVSHTTWSHLLSGAWKHSDHWIGLLPQEKWGITES